MRDLIRVRVVEARKGKNPIDEKDILHVRLEPYEPILLNAEEVGYLWTAVTNEDTRESWGWRQAQLRYALGLDPVYLETETLEVPEFSAGEINAMPGKDMIVAVDLQGVPEMGLRLRVLDFYKARNGV